MGSLGALPEGSTSYSYFTGSMINENDNQFQKEKELDVERFDLDDEVLFVVNLRHEDSEYSVKVHARRMTIASSTDGKDINIDLDFDVDIEHSSVSTRNGVMEISLKIAAKGSLGAREGYLKVN